MSKFSRDRVKGFLHTQGRFMVNGDGEKIVLRGWGVGNWLNPEGFMIGGPAFVEDVDLSVFSLPRRYERGRSVDLVIRELCGSRFAEEYQQKWIENYFTEADVAYMAELGYNSVRLPLDARLFLAEEPEIIWKEENFALLDRVLDWCEKHRIYAILDMHAAVGGQSALPCDDGVDNRPHTFTEPESRERTMLLWEKLAARYADRWIVGGYDLLNEPISGPGNLYLMPELRSFYEELIARIRKLDRKHMLTIEGAIFSADLDIFEEDFDPECHNWCVHTHFYGFSPEVRELYRFLEISELRNVPIWIGEGGSDDLSNCIFYDIAGAYDIGYALWSWKCAERKDRAEQNNPLINRLPDNWKLIQEYCRNGGPRPGYQESQKIFSEMLELIRFENCRQQRKSSVYTLRQPGITLPAVGFDEVEGSFSGLGWRLGNTFRYRTETGMKMVRRPGYLPAQMLIMPTQEPGVRRDRAIDALCLELRSGEKASYTVRDAQKAFAVILSGRVCGKDEAILRLICSNEEGLSCEKMIRLASGEKGETIEVYAFAQEEMEKLLPSGEVTLQVCVEKGTVQLDEICF